jgi:uncharacterized protein YecT (DUF1311 family)
MKRHSTAILLAQALILSCLHGQNWEFKTGEEDWGETVYASQSNASGAAVTIFTATEEFKPAILISPYKPSYGDSFAVVVTVDKNPPHRLKGASPEYFEEIYVEGVGKGLLEEMKRGEVISISVAEKDTHTFTLAGSTKALGQLDGSAHKEEEVPLESAPAIKKHPIEVEMETAIDENPSTMGMRQAFGDARDKWEKEIIKSFSKLKEAMEPEEFEALRVSQRAWETYRDAEVKAQGEIYSRQQGTIWGPISNSAEMELYRSRALQLDEYLGAVSERGE